MGELNIYSPEFDSREIFKALDRLKKDDLLPEEGMFGFLYENFQYPGTSMFLRHKKDARFFYIDHDDFFIEIRDQNPDWAVGVDGNVVRLSLIYQINGRDIPVSFVFSTIKTEYRELLDIVRKKKAIEVYFLSMIYGGLVLESYIKLKLPSHVINVLKKLK